MPAIDRNLRIKMYRNYTVCVHVHNLHPGANLFAPPRRQEQICTRVQILKTPFTSLVRDCQFGVSPVNYSDSDGQKNTSGANLHPGANSAHERCLRKCIHTLNEFVQLKAFEVLKWPECNK